MELRTRTIGLLSLALLSIAVGGPSSAEACECDRISLQPLSFAGHAGRTADGRTLLREGTGFLIHGAGEWLSGVVARCGGNLVARAIPPDSPVLLTRGTGP